MKTIGKNLSLFLILLGLGFIQLGFSQEAEINKELPYLTEDQRLILKEQQKLLAEQKAIFKASLSEDQLKVLNNSNLSRQERTNILRQSLSDAQRNTLDLNKRSFAQKRQHFRRSLTVKQKSRLRKFLAKRDLKQRRRILRRLRFLIQQNMD